MKQELIDFGHAQCSVIYDNGERYFPLRYVVEKVLLRSKAGVKNMQNKSEYKQFMKMCNVNFDHVKAGIQHTNCVSEDGLKMFLLNTQVGRLSVEARKAQNKIMAYLNLSLVSERELVIKNISYELLDEHDPEIRQLILDTVEKKDANFQLCTHCDKYYPLDKLYFNPDSRATTGFVKICYPCYKGLDLVDKRQHISYDKNRNKKVDILSEYNKYIIGEIDKLPLIIDNKESYLEIIKYLYKEGRINKGDINIWKIRDKFKLTNIKNYFSTKNLYKELLDEELHNEDDSELDTYETRIETEIINNIHRIEDGMRYIDRQYDIDGGVIDIVARDKNDKLCLIEVKIIDNNVKLIWQASYYQSQFEEPIRMITIAPSYTDRLYSALVNVKNTEIMYYWYDNDGEIIFAEYKPMEEIKIKYKQDISKIM